MPELGRYVSKKTQESLEKAERNNPDGIAVVIEENKEDQQHESFDPVEKSEISLNKIFGESLIKEDKTKMEEIKETKEESKFENLFTFRDKIKSINDGKYYQIKLRFNEKGETLPKGQGYWSVLLKGTQYCKVQPTYKDGVRFWLFKDATYTLTKAEKNKETGEWEYHKLGKIDTPTLKIMVEGRKDL